MVVRERRPSKSAQPAGNRRVKIDPLSPKELTRLPPRGKEGAAMKATTQVFTLWKSLPRKHWVAAATEEVNLTEAEHQRVRKIILEVKGARRKTVQTPVKTATYRQRVE